MEELNKSNQENEPAEPYTNIGSEEPSEVITPPEPEYIPSATTNPDISGEFIELNFKEFNMRLHSRHKDIQELVCFCSNFVLWFYEKGLLSNGNSQSKTAVGVG